MADGQSDTALYHAPHRGRERFWFVCVRGRRSALPQPVLAKTPILELVKCSLPAVGWRFDFQVS